jgi:hypothetical protein
MRVTEVEHQRGTTRVVAADWADGNNAPLGADPGRNLPGPDLQIGATRLILAELPTLGTDDPGRPVVVAAAAGTGAGWRRAALSAHDGSRVVELGGTNGIAMMGNLFEPLAAHSSLLEDQFNEPVVRLLHDAMTLPPGTGDPFSFDAPLLSIAGELVRYGNADQIGLRDYRLKRLARGCFGSRSNLSHATNAEVFLLDRDSVFRIDAVPTPIGENLTIEAMGISDDIPVQQSIPVIGYAVTPRSPIHGKIEKLQGGEVSLRWIRRDRLAFGWADGTDLPNSEGQTEFAVELWHDATMLKSWTVGEPALTIEASELSVLALPASTNLEFRVRQVGRFALSPALILNILI